jgi:hypothetical protein
MPASETSALDAVLSADVERARLVEEEKRLTSLAEKSSDDAKRLVEVYARLGEIEADRAVSRCVLR